MKTWTAIDSVRVVRHFADRPLEPAHLRRILDAGRRTGSSKNRQEWTFIVVRDRTRLMELSKVGPYAGHLAGAAVAIALVAPDRLDRWDLGRAAQDMVLAAWELGIGSVPATVYEPQLVTRILALPADQDCRYLLSFGYPADASVLTRPNRPGGRKPLTEVVFDEQWGQAWSDTDPAAPDPETGIDVVPGELPAAFDAATLASLEEAGEIEIETRAAPGAPAHHTVIWVVVEDGRAFIRTVRGPRSRWYREAIAHPRAAVTVGPERISVRVVRADDPTSVGLCSFGLARKYAGDPSLPAMLSPDVLGTTLRLEPDRGAI
jgi:nitroreductase